jgi:hypothetical protein
MKPGIMIVLAALAAATIPARAAASEPAAMLPTAPAVAAMAPATLTDAVTAEAAAPAVAPQAGAVTGWGPLDAKTGVTLESFLYMRRPVVVFADSPDQPQFVQQMRLLSANPSVLEERDAVVIFDTDPQGGSAVRSRLRPRGFSLVIMEKDGSVIRRKPAPADLREIAATIDRTPLRRQEMLERRPAGR